MRKVIAFGILFSVFVIAISVSTVSSLSPTIDTSCCQLMASGEDIDNELFREDCESFELTEEKCEIILSDFEETIEEWEKANKIASRNNFISSNRIYIVIAIITIIVVLAVWVIIFVKRRKKG